MSASETTSIVRTGAAFRARIRDVRMATLFDHWLGLAAALPDRGGGLRAPRRGDLDPLRFSAALAFVWLIDYDVAGAGFVYRLAGDHVRETLGRPIKGRALADVITDQAGETLAHERFRRVIETPAAMLVTGEVYQAVNTQHYGQRLALPLSVEEGAAPAAILGVTIPEIQGPAGADVVPADHLILPSETLLR